MIDVCDFAGEMEKTTHTARVQQKTDITDGPIDHGTSLLLS